MSTPTLMSFDELREAITGAPLRDVKDYHRQLEKHVRRCWQEGAYYILHGLIDVRWKILEPEFNKHGLTITKDHHHKVVPIGATA